MTKSHWSLADIPWADIEPDKVPPYVLAAVKAAAVVEANSADYVTYLHNVFSTDESFKDAASHWGLEERQHGDALGRWAELVDPSFDFDEALLRFRQGYQIPLAAATSVRGSRAGELVARCVVESGTCSFYSALRDNGKEPVLRKIAAFIAQDEARHYQLFKTHLSTYLNHRKLGLFERCRVAFKRVAEADDDELAYAFYAANSENDGAGVAYNRRQCAKSYSKCTLALYDYPHVRAATHMILNAADLNPSGHLARVGLWVGWKWMRWQKSRLTMNDALSYQS